MRQVKTVTSAFLRFPALPKAADWSLVCFTLMTQSAVGLVFLDMAGNWCSSVVQTDMSFRTMALAFGLTSAGLLAALTHLAAPRHAPHALRNTAASWLSREALLVPMFALALVLSMAAERLGASGAPSVLKFAALLLGCSALWAMIKVYLLETVPAWNTPATALEFIGSALLLGGALSIVAAFFGSAAALGWKPAFTVAVIGMCLGLIIKLAAIYPGMAAECAAQDQVWYQPPASILSAGQSRAIRSVLNMIGVVLILAAAHRGWPSVLFPGFGILVVGEVIGRLRFYRRYGRIGL